MNFALCNITVRSSPTYAELNKIISEKVLKEIAFNRKTVYKDIRTTTYEFVLFPCIENDLTEEQLKQADLFASRIEYESLSTSSAKEIYSISQIFYDSGKEDWEDENFSISILDLIPEDKIDVGYSDGSFKKATNEASFGAVKILNDSFDSEELNDGTVLFDGFTESYRKYEKIKSYKIPHGTNNIGELYGIKELVKRFNTGPDKKKFQVIISDSEYSLKIFRERIYVWEENNYCLGSGKVMANKNLAIEIQDSIVNTDSIIFYKWIKGHTRNQFNEICDSLAKKELDIKGGYYEIKESK